VSRDIARLLFFITKDEGELVILISHGGSFLPDQVTSMLKVSGYTSVEHSSASEGGAGITLKAKKT
jgi:hypothetical protein